MRETYINSLGNLSLLSLLDVTEFFQCCLDVLIKLGKIIEVSLDFGMREIN